MPPRIVTISDHVDCPTGFGVQHRLVAAALARAGYDVHSVGIWDTRPLATIATDPGAPTHTDAHGHRPCQSVSVRVTRYPGGQGADDHRRAWAMYRDLLRPDLVITLGDFETFAHLNDGAARPFAWCHWLPLDALPYPAREHERMLRYDRLVLMSRFAMELVRPHLEGRVPLHCIPHGVDTTAFRPHEEPLALRRRWARRLGAELRPDDFLLIARDTNQWRKQQPLLLDALARTPRGVKLLLHCRPIAHPDANGWDLPRVAALYGVADRVVFTSPPSGRLALSPRELAELDNLADLRVSATQGEGFGVITIEAMACGTPTLITDYTTSRELLLGVADTRRSVADLCEPGAPGADRRSPPLLDRFGPAGEPVRVAAWTVEQRRGLLRPVVSAEDLAARIVALRDDRLRLARYAVAGLRRVFAAYTAERVAAAWLALAREALAGRP